MSLPDAYHKLRVERAVTLFATWLATMYALCCSPAWRRVSRALLRGVQSYHSAKLSFERVIRRVYLGVALFRTSLNVAMDPADEEMPFYALVQEGWHETHAIKFTTHGDVLWKRRVATDAQALVVQRGIMYVCDSVCTVVVYRADGTSPLWFNSRWMPRDALWGYCLCVCPQTQALAVGAGDTIDVYSTGISELCVGRLLHSYTMAESKQKGHKQGLALTHSHVVFSHGNTNHVGLQPRWDYVRRTTEPTEYLRGQVPFQAVQNVATTACGDILVADRGKVHVFRHSDLACVHTWRAPPRVRLRGVLVGARDTVVVITETGHACILK